jgi:hypothetical protein
LVNFYWQAYFTLTFPLCEYLTKNGVEFFKNKGIIFKEDSEIIKTKENYLLFLNNIKNISKELWKSENLNIFNNQTNHYYQHEIVKKAAGIITTNYTPIISSTNNNNIAQINGSL